MPRPQSHQAVASQVAAVHQEASPVAVSAVHQEVDGKMKKVLSILVIMALLLAGCSPNKDVAQASYGVSRKGFTTHTSW